MKQRCFLFCFFLISWIVFIGQEKKTGYLLNDLSIQIESTEAVDSLYNFNFIDAERQFQWIIQENPEHPLGYFLMSLSNWWKLLPEDHIRSYDSQLFYYLNQTISISKDLLKKDDKNEEADFFLAATYGLKARVYSDREQYRKAGSASSSALKYLKIDKERKDFSPEFLFGEALYNYFREWIPENKKYLKPILFFFRKGNKELGIKQLEKASSEAFYTRVEALTFLMKIYGDFEENNIKKAISTAKYLHKQYPNNSYFQMHYARYCYKSGRFNTSLKLSEDIMRKFNTQTQGYGLQNARYASYYAGYIKLVSKKDTLSAIVHFNNCVNYSEQLHFEKRAYYRRSLDYLASIALVKGEINKANLYYEKIKKYGDKKSGEYKRAKSALKAFKKRRKH